MSRTIYLNGVLIVLMLAIGCTTKNSFDPVGGRDAEVDAAEDTTDTSEPDTAQPDVAEDVPEDTPAPDVGPMGTCESDDDCTATKECVTARCGDDGYCAWEVTDGFCFIRNVCHPVGTANPSNECEACDPAADAQAWTVREDGAECTGGDACLTGNTCQAGECQTGEAIDCDDGDPCTDDSCDPALGCVHDNAQEPNACDDGDPCTVNDVCGADGCAGVARDCNDDNVCTDDSCDGESGECVNAPNTAACDDGDACTDGDVCADGECGPGPAPNCDDGNICTIDGCSAFAGCFHLPAESPCCIGEDSVCDDGNPCTNDLCDPEGGDCIYENNTAACDDMSACTDNDTCSEGECGGTEITCNDGNGCTEDFCDPLRGCQTRDLNAIACDDGIECTVQDMCVEGACVGNDEGCVCVPEFAEVANRMNTVQLGANGRPGQGLDVDGDPDTCSPSNDCDGGIDNALGVLAGIVNPPLAESVMDGSVNLILEYTGYGENPFALALHQAGLAPNNRDCNVQAQTCDWLVTDDLLDPDTCDRLVTLDATLDGNQLTAGGPGTIFPFSLPLGDAVIELTLYEVTLVGTVAERNGRVATSQLVLGGAVRRSELVEALGALDPESLPVPPETIAQILDIVVQDDVDTNNDGEPDAASIGIRLDGIEANITGVQ